MVTVYGEFFGEPISSPREMNTGIYKLACKALFNLCFALGFYEALLGPPDEEV